MVDASLLRLLEMLPQIMGIVQIIVYFILAWFFGSIAMKGMKKHLIFPIRIVLSWCIGFLCLIAGIVIAGYIPFLQDSIFRLFQIDITIGSIIASVVLAIALFMITKKTERTDHKTLIDKLKKRVGLLEGLLVEHKVPPIKEEEAKKIAEKALHGYKFKDAKLNKTDWEVFLHKEKRKAKVVMGAYDGEIKIIEHDMSNIEHLISDPLRIVGIGIIIFIVAFALINFRGFPNMADGISSLFGMSPDGLAGMFGGDDENLPEGCVSAARIAIKYNPQLPPYENADVESMIESSSGADIHWMYNIDYEGENYILAIDNNFEKICSATEDKFCSCMEIPFL